MTNGKNENDGQPNLPQMRNEFLSAITRLVEATAPAQQASACVDALVEHIGRLGVGVNTGWAQRAFQSAQEAGRLAKACMDWWDELLFDIRYPVACCHIVTGTLPGDCLSNTVAAISVYGRDGKPLAHDVVEWADFASTDLTDEESYGGFNKAIREATVRLGARSLFKFCDGDLSSSISIAHDPEQGPCWFHERSYRRRESDGGDENAHEDEGGRSAGMQASGDDVSDSGDPVSSGRKESDFFGELKRREALQCLSVLPPEWKDEIAGLGEGQTFEKMGKAWFYKPPHDEEDCNWEAVVRNGILHVECEVGPETLRRNFDIPMALTSATFTGAEQEAKETE
jgi:hypothetical protein